MGGDSQAAGERGGRSEQRKEKPRKMASVGNWCCSLPGPEGGIFVHCSLMVGAAPGEFPSLRRQKSREGQSGNMKGAVIIARNAYLD